ncbi:hypothetical protein U8Q05_29940 (plasmid) [Rhizobium ruizarguesonis]|nr:hypothetical protein U8Q05_29940 [Rhizobium ruizarguesonis]
MKTMDDIVVEHSEGVLRVELNRPEKMNAMTSSMYLKLADIFDDAAKDEACASCSGTAPAMPSPLAMT